MRKCVEFPNRHCFRGLLRDCGPFWPHQDDHEKTVCVEILENLFTLILLLATFPSEGGVIDLNYESRDCMEVN